AEVWVEPRKAGRTTASSRVTLVQDDQPVVDLQITTGTLAADVQPDFAAQRTRRLPAIESCLSGDSGKSETGTRNRGFADQVDMRFDPAVMGWLDGNPSGRLEGGAYFRLQDGQEPDPFVLAVAVDALPPVALNT